MVQRVFLTVLTLLLCGCGPFWRSPAYFTDYEHIPLSEPVLTMEQYSQRAEDHPRPYIVAISDTLILFGAEHTKDPADPQIDSIAAAWRRFSPTVALVEGRLGFLFSWVSDPVEQYGESGYVMDLAKKDGIPCYSWEPPLNKEVAWMLERHSRQRTALFYIMRPYFGQVKFGKPEDPDNIVEGLIKKRTAVPGLEGSITSVTAIDSIWKADFTGLKNWRDTDDRFGWPGYLNGLAAESNAFRDEHFAQVIIRLVRQGERVFAVCGSSHAVKLESAVRSTLLRKP